MKLLSERMDKHYPMNEIEETKQKLIKEMAFGTEETALKFVNNI